MSIATALANTETLAAGCPSQLGPAQETAVREAVMGDIIRPRAVPMKLSVEAIGTAPLERIDVLHGEYGAGGDFDLHREARGESWQRTQAEALASALTARSIPIWRDELPPELDR